MAKKEKPVGTNQAASETENDLTAQLIKDINREFGLRVAYNLAESDAPTIVKNWISTGSRQLDYAIRNASGGGYPGGRIIEITSAPSCGKSHLGFAAAANVQAQGGLVILIDTETAVMLDKLHKMGIDVRKRFVYCDTHCTEEVFQIIESVILKAKQIATTKDVPILVIWDSVASSAPKAELDGDYDQSFVGLQARAISKGMRKITGVIGQNNVTLMCINQLRSAIGVMHGDPDVPPGGRAIPFHSSVRIRLSSGTQIKVGDVVVGIHVLATIKKNKVERPFRKCEFDIIFGKGIVEHEYIFDAVRLYCEKNKVILDGKEIKISGLGGWKLFTVTNEKTGEVLVEKNFHKSDFGDMMNDPQYKVFLDAAIDAAYTVKDDAIPVGDGESPETDEEETSE